MLVFDLSLSQQSWAVASTYPVPNFGQVLINAAFIGNLPATGYSRALREADSECYF
jgi:hypothetical protein